MRAADQIFLVLMGGGALATGVAVTSGNGADCHATAAPGVPQTTQSCNDHVHGYISSGGSRRSRLVSGGRESAFHAVMRGGFGLHFGGFGG